MKAGLLFCRSGRTSVCERLLGRTAGRFGAELSGVKVCTRDSLLGPCTAALLRGSAVVFAVGGTLDGRPSCAEALFRALRIPLDARGEPSGVLKLTGGGLKGYLIESEDQAILLLPDDPGAMLEMLPPAFGRLKRKFGLPGEFPEEPELDYGRLVEESMGEPASGGAE